MRIGDILQVEITSSGMNGEGVARANDLVIFIPLTLVGEIVNIKIVEVKKSFARGRVTKVITPSPLRVEPFCPIFYQCGGCEMQHIDYNQQLLIKKEWVSNCIKKECGIVPNIQDSIASPDVFGYRNKIQVPISQDGSKIIAGYYKSNSHTIVPFGSINSGVLGDCPLHTRVFQDILDIFCKFLEDNNISVYNERLHKGLVRHLVIRKIGDSFGIVVVINGDNLPNSRSLIQQYIQYGLSFSLYLSVNNQRTNVIVGKRTFAIFGNERLNAEMMGIKFQVSPLSFMQINDKVRDMIYKQVADIISAEKDSIVIDAYSGIGILSNIMAKYAKKVFAIEIVKDAIKDANELAKLNNNDTRIHNICGDATIELPKLMQSIKAGTIADIPKDTKSKTILVLDPPRKGCDQPVIDAILQALPTKIVYISCNPATLARDINLLQSHYTISLVQPYDMFPMTGHVETVVLLSRVEK